MNKELLIKSIANAYAFYVVDTLNAARADDEKDPEYSGITCRNMIETLIAYEELTEAPQNIFYKNVREYMIFEASTEDEIEKFEKKVQAEIDEYGDRIPSWKTEP